MAKQFDYIIQTINWGGQNTSVILIKFENTGMRSEHESIDTTIEVIIVVVFLSLFVQADNREWIGVLLG